MRWLYTLLAALFLVGSSLSLTACGDDDGEDLDDITPSPGAGDGGSGGSDGGDGGSGGGSGGSGGSGGGGSSDCVPDPDEERCDTCLTWEENPFNACSDQVEGCIPFDNGRIPGWPNPPTP